MLASTHVVAVGLCVGVVALAVVVRHALVQHVLSILQGLDILTSMHVYTVFKIFGEGPYSSLFFVESTYYLELCYVF